MASGRFIETLEGRCLLSVSLPEGDQLGSAAAKGGKGTPTVGPAIRLGLVTLHELGHSLGLAHSDNPSSIMYAYYNANYDLNSFASDPSVTTFRSLFSSPDAGPWKDSADPVPNDGVVEITYSFMPDGARMDKGSNDLNATFNRLYGSDTAWKGIIEMQLARWASVSNGMVSFVAHSDAGLAFNYVGSAQNDARSGDIRIGAHRFDGAGKTLAHAYYPPPNGFTAAGDLHLDSAENWDGKLNSAITYAATAYIAPAGSAATGLFTYTATPASVGSSVAAIATLKAEKPDVMDQNAQAVTA